MPIYIPSEIMNTSQMKGRLSKSEILDIYVLWMAKSGADLESKPGKATQGKEMEHPISSTISFSKLFMLALLFSALFLSPANAREIPTYQLLNKGEKYVRGDVGIDRRPYVPPPSPRANGSPPGGIFGSHG